MGSDALSARGYRRLAPKENHSADREFAYEVLSGLSERPKRLPSRFFYDEVGSELFARIMRCTDYYPTDCEHEILSAHRGDIADAIADTAVHVVDLGAGDGAKTFILLEHLERRSVDFQYVPIDISESAVAGLTKTCAQRFPSMSVQGLVAEYTDGLEHLAEAHGDRRNLVLFLGSNIGNFDRARARAFLRRLWTALNPGDLLLVGFDLKKDIELLLRAYNDREGLTARFNLNLLDRINRELGGHFATERFRHFGTYDVFSGAMESYLVSLERQSVAIDALQLAFDFDPWEPIHTEYSYKYLRSDVTELARDTGFSIEAEFLDERRWFLDSLWRVQKVR
ncbi:MAG: L-histidine N(alpha)-methyltransferase [Polyangiaceae bacterium]